MTQRKYQLHLSNSHQNLSKLNYYQHSHQFQKNYQSNLKIISKKDKNNSNNNSKFFKENSRGYQSVIQSPNKQKYQDNYSNHHQKRKIGNGLTIKDPNCTFQHNQSISNNSQHYIHTKKTSNISDTLSGRMKKIDYVSNPVSKNSSPKKIVQMKKNHRRNISANDNLIMMNGTSIMNANSLNNNKNNNHQKQQNTDAKFLSTTSSTYYNNHQKQKQDIITKNSFSYKFVIGRGGFGKVWKVQMKKNKKIYALKEMSKALVITKKSVPSVINQKQLLCQLSNPFIVNMAYSMQDRQNLYLLMEYLPGGDLRHHIAQRRRFSEQEAKFIICCILMGLAYLHENKIIHRDIKPQNIVMDEKGYVRVTDMGIARKYRQNNAQDTSGTPGYMAPQVLCRQNHTYTVDYFALGVIAYELMLRKRPYQGRSRKQIRDQVLARQIQIKKHQIPQGWSIESGDFINRLIFRKPHQRLGVKGIQSIKSHPWLRLFPFDLLQKKQLKAPFVPNQGITDQTFDSMNISSQNTQVKQLIQQNLIMLRDPQVQKLFQGYQFNNTLQSKNGRYKI